MAPKNLHISSILRPAQLYAKSLEFKRYGILWRVHTDRCDNHLQTKHISIFANQMRTQSDAAQFQFLVRQQIVHEQCWIRQWEIMMAYMHRTHVLNVILNAGYQNGHLRKGIERI